MIAFDATNKIITLSGSATFAWTDIYNAAKAWDDDATSMGQHHPLDASSELLFTLRYGWVLKPSGYSSGSTVTVSGKVTTLPEGEDKTTPATTGSQVTWQLDVPATAIIVATGSGVTAQDKLDIADAVWDETLSGHLGTGSTGTALDGAGGESATPPTVEEIRTEMDTNSKKLKFIKNQVA